MTGINWGQALTIGVGIAAGVLFAGLLIKALS